MKKYEKFPYTLRTEVADGIKRYFVSYEEGDVAIGETEISRPVYWAFVESQCSHRNSVRWNERHGDDADIDNNSTYKRMYDPPKPLEDQVLELLRNEQLRLALANLTETQRRRLLLYHDYGLTFKQIADMEVCKRQSVTRSIRTAEDKVKDFLKFS